MKKNAGNLRYSLYKINYRISLQGESCQRALSMFTSPLSLKSIFQRIPAHQANIDWLKSSSV